MLKILLTPVLFGELVVLEFVKNRLIEVLDIPTSVQKHEVDLESSFNDQRGQYDALKIIQSYQNADDGKTLICTSVDLYIPIFTFVFGLAQLGGNVGVISSHRLDNQYYGLKKDKNLLGDRLAKETIHELGHLLGLRHCPQYKCVMAISNTAEEVDIKSFEYCNICDRKLHSNLKF